MKLFWKGLDKRREDIWFEKKTKVAKRWHLLTVLEPFRNSEQVGRGFKSKPRDA